MKTTRKTWWGIGMIALGVLLLLDSIGTLDIGDFLTTYWPLILVVWGGSMLMSARPGSRSTTPSTGLRVLGNVEQNSPMESVMSTNVAGNLKILVTSRAFKGGMASTVFGEVSVDCSECEPAVGEHTLRLSSVFGKANFIPPRGAAIRVSAHTLFGTARVFEEKKGGFSANVQHESDGYAAAAKRLHVDISQVFGDIEVGR